MHFELKKLSKGDCLQTCHGNRRDDFLVKLIFILWKFLDTQVEVHKSETPVL